MRTSLLAALVVLSSAPAWADSTFPVDAPISADAAPAAKPAPTPSDEDEDEAPKPAAAAKPAAAPAPAPLGAVSTTPEAGVNQQKLVSGAPLYNPNVAVHIVEKKEFSDRNRIEVIVQPSLQINGKFTQHYGIGGSVLWHLQENFALMIMGVYNYVSEESGFNGELITKVRAEAQAATSLLLNGGLIGGVEAMPFYGKFVWFDNYLVHFSFVLNGGAGAGSTRHQLKPISDCTNATGNCFTEASYGDTGWRFMAEIGGGLRVQIGKWVAIRIELRDLLYTARVDNVNGCNNDDLKAMDQILLGGGDISKAKVGGNCNVSTFTGTESSGRKRSDDVPLAFTLVKTPSSDVLNNLGLYIGLSGNF